MPSIECCFFLKEEKFWNIIDFNPISDLIVAIGFLDQINIGT